jgi:DNA-binding NtrC family response regulator
MPGNSHSAAPQAATAKPTVLLVDDDLAVLESIAMLLELRGFRVVTATNGRAGLAAFRKHSPAAVITDILMPEEDGLGAIREMRRERPDAKIIAMSGGGWVDKADYLTIAEQLGADAAFEKIETEKLIDALEAMLNGP